MTRKFLTPIILPADPTAALQAATKQYVDGKAGGSFNYTFNDSAPAPSTGEIRLIDPSNHSAATSITFSNTTADGLSVGTRLGLIRPGNTIYLYTVSAPTRWQSFKAATSGYDDGGYTRVDVTTDDGSAFDFLAGAMVAEILPGITNEVIISPDTPTAINVDLWVDSDAPTMAGAPASDATPTAVAAVATPGTGTQWARGDHVHSAGVWQAWTPTLTQGGAVSTSTALGRYTRIGNLVIGDFWIIASGAGTGGQVIQISRPVIGRTIASSIRSIGGAYTSITGIGQTMVHVVDPNNGAVFHFIRGDVTGAANYFGPDPNCAIAATNSFGGSFMYEAL